jgi:hypothetical protein
MGGTKYIFNANNQYGYPPWANFQLVAAKAAAAAGQAYFRSVYGGVMNHLKEGLIPNQSA